VPSCRRVSSASAVASTRPPGPGLRRRSAVEGADVLLAGAAGADDVLVRVGRTLHVVARSPVGRYTAGLDVALASEGGLSRSCGRTDGWRRLEQSATLGC